MFQGGERLGETTECRGLFRVISIIFIFTVNVESSLLLAELNFEAGFLHLSLAQVQIWSRRSFLPSFLSASFQWSLFPPFPRPRLEFPTLAFWGTHPILLILPQMVELKLLSLHHL